MRISDWSSDVCSSDLVGWQLTVRAASRRRSHTGGAHGFDPASPEMRAVFVADGPSFADGAVLPPFDNVDVYPLLMELLGVPAQPNDGDRKSTRLNYSHYCAARMPSYA